MVSAGPFLQNQWSGSVHFLCTLTPSVSECVWPCQQAYYSPGVFNFYLPEFIPAGALEEAGLVSPESQTSTAPQIIGFLNGMSSLIDHGLTDCGDGFGGKNWPQTREVKGFTSQCDVNKKDTWAELSDGLLEFKPTEPNHP